MVLSMVTSVGILLFVLIVKDHFHLTELLILWIRDVFCL